MPQSLSQIYLHLIFSTKNRQPLLKKGIRDEVYSYIGGLLKNLDSPPSRIGGEIDHIHALFSLSKNRAPKEVVQIIKQDSSKWIKERWDDQQDFYWQTGYGLFSVSASRLPNVKRYIDNQEEHHRVISFKEEFVKFLDEYKIEYNPRYLWEEEFHG